MVKSIGDGKIPILILCTDEKEDNLEALLKEHVEQFSNLQFMLLTHSDNSEETLDKLIPIVVIDITHIINGYSGIGPRWMGILKKSIGGDLNYDENVKPDFLENEYLVRHEVSTIFMSLEDNNCVDSLTKIFKYLNGS